MDIKKYFTRHNLYAFLIVIIFLAGSILIAPKIQQASMFVFSDIDLYISENILGQRPYEKPGEVIVAKSKYIINDKSTEQAVLGEKTKRTPKTAQSNIKEKDRKTRSLVEIAKAIIQKNENEIKPTNESKKEVAGVTNIREPHSNVIKNVKFYVSGKEYVVPFSKYSKCVRFNESPFCAERYAYFDNNCLLSELKNTDFIKKTLETYTLKGAGKSVILTKGDMKLDLTEAIVLMNAELKRRYNPCSPYKSFKSLYIQVPVDITAPNTNGQVSERYLEADGSRQLMFYWENGKYTTFRMSGAYTAWNPVGVHKFFYKSKRSWSKYTGTWMPYWMAFTRDAKQDGALLGVHGLIYWCPKRTMYCDPKYYTYETTDHLGVQRSRGCLRLGPEDIKFVYSKIRVGDYIVVHD